MRRFTLLSAMSVAIALHAADTAAPTSAATPPDSAAAAAPAPRATPAAKKIEHDGQTFELVSSTTGKNVETDEYIQAGEKLTDWTQLLTVQRITTELTGGSDDFVAYFQKRLEKESGASLQILKQSKPVSVFAVRFPKSDTNDEQVMICLAFGEPAKPGLLNVIQYAIKPTRVSVNLVEMRIRSWRDRFLKQADAIIAKSN